VSWRKQEVKKLHNKDLRADPAWGLNSGQIESNPGYFPGSRWLRAVAQWRSEVKCRSRPTIKFRPFHSSNLLREFKMNEDRVSCLLKI